MSHKLEIGKTYKQREALLHIIALHDGYALIENHYDGKVTQYIVTSGLYIEDNGELHWNGSGKYYRIDCHDGKDASDVLNVAWQDFYGMAKPILSFSLPNGATINAGLYGGDGPIESEKCGWQSIDVSIRFPNGEETVLCAADFENAGSLRHHDKLRVLGFKHDQEDAAFDCEFPWKHYSCWIQHEEADYTYDICIWDEILNERAQDLEESRFYSMEAAKARLAEIREWNSHIRWTIRDDTIGKG